MKGERYFGSLKTERDAWKRDTLFGRYTPEQLDYRRYQKKRRKESEKEEEEYTTPEIPLHPRFEGMWAVGLPGTGKTQLFQHFLMRDLDLVAKGEASVVILDPTGTKPGTLIRTVTRLKRFAPGGDLYNRLVYIDPTDRRYTLPINLLSLHADLTDDDAISSAISSYVSIMGRVGAKMLLPGLGGAAAERYGATPSSAGCPMPYRFNEPRRHKIPRARYRVQNGSVQRLGVCERAI